jgi:hypothetical protein
MKKPSASFSSNIFGKINHFIEETDIRILVFAPPIVGFIGLLIGILLMNLLTQGNPYRPITYILLALLSFLLCFSGYSEIYKKEMPGPFGGIYKGNLAVVSGVFTIIVFGLLGMMTLIYGISRL